MRADPDATPGADQPRRGLQRPQTLTNVVIQHISESVIRGEYKPGQALPEVALAAQLQTSRGTVREALRALRDKGLVEIREHRGAFVQSIGPQRIREVFNLRSLLECYALETALTEGLVDEDDLEKCRAAYASLTAAVTSGDIFAIVEADINLHYTIASTCRQELLLSHLRTIQMETRRAIILTKVLDSDVTTEIESHAPIMSALADGDPSVARKVMNDHIETACGQLLARLKDEELA